MPQAAVNKGCTKTAALNPAGFSGSFEEEDGYKDEDEDEEEYYDRENVIRGVVRQMSIPPPLHNQGLAAGTVNYSELVKLGANGINIYNELVANGFGPDASIAEIRKQCGESPDTYSFDSVMLALISQLDGSKDAQRRYDEEEYNKVWDATLRESENERDCVQVRKKARIEEIVSNCSLSLEDIASSEFMSSILLTERRFGKSSGGDERNCLALERCIKFLDHMSCKKSIDSIDSFVPPSSSTASSSSSGSSSSISCRCLNSMKELRENVVKLLILERDAIKWWKTVAYSYLMQVGTRLDARKEGLGDFNLVSNKILNEFKQVRAKTHVILCAMFFLRMCIL